MAKTVIKLGGSLIVPDRIDTNFLVGFKTVVADYIHADNQVGLVIGGGATARNYQIAAEQFNSYEHSLDEIGIQATRLNALLVKSAFGELAYPQIYVDYSQQISDFKLLIAAGDEPGHSTDYGMVRLARNIGATKAIVMTNVDCIYSSDPRKDSAASPIFNMRWAQYRDMVGSWQPGMHVPIDPVAAQVAESIELEIIVAGSDLGNLENILQGKVFRGTTIRP